MLQKPGTGNVYDSKLPVWLWNSCLFIIHLSPICKSIQIPALAQPRITFASFDHEIWPESRYNLRTVRIDLFLYFQSLNLPPLKRIDFPALLQKIWISRFFFKKLIFSPFFQKIKFLPFFRFQRHAHSELLQPLNVKNYLSASSSVVAAGHAPFVRVGGHSHHQSGGGHAPQIHASSDHIYALVATPQSEIGRRRNNNNNSQQKRFNR